MKKILLFFTVTLLFLSACGDNEKQDDTSKKEQEVETTAEEKPEDNKTEENDQNEGMLTEIGQIEKEPSYSVELLNKKDINETLEHGPLSLHLIDAKLIKMFDMKNEVKSELQFFSSDEIPDEVSYLQLQYTVNNTSDKDITWYRIENVVTDTGKQVDGNNDFLSMEYIYDIFAGVEVDYVNGFMVDEDADEFRLIFSPVYEQDGYEIASDGIEYNFSFSE